MKAVLRTTLRGTSERHAQKKKVLNAFISGMKVHGIPVIAVDDVKPHLPCDLLTTWSHGLQLETLFETQREAGKPYLILENPHIGDLMTEWISLGFNGLKGTANYNNKMSPSDRWFRYHKDKLWSNSNPIKQKAHGKHVLVIGQVASDSSVRGAPFNKGPIWGHWIQGVIARLKQITHRKVIYRPHPLCPETVTGSDDTDNGDLYKALDDAHVVVTLSSNVGVDAILHGVPVIALGPNNMVKDVAMDTLCTLNVNTPVYPSDKRLMQWAYDLSYAQWTFAEIASGEAWAHLKAVVA